jgi:hypothetical protein
MGYRTAGLAIDKSAGRILAVLRLFANITSKLSPPSAQSRCKGGKGCRQLMIAAVLFELSLAWQPAVVYYFPLQLGLTARM